MKKIMLIALLLIGLSTQVIQAGQPTPALSTQSKPGFLFPTFAGLTVGAGIGIGCFHGFKWGAQSLLDYSSKHFAQEVSHKYIEQAATFTQTDAFKPVVSGFAVLTGAYFAARFAASSHSKYELIKAKNDAIIQIPEKIKTLSEKVNTLAEEVKSLTENVATKTDMKSYFEILNNTFTEHLTNPAARTVANTRATQSTEVLGHQNMVNNTHDAHPSSSKSAGNNRKIPNQPHATLHPEKNRTSSHDENISQHSYAQRAAIGLTGALLSGFASFFFNK